MRCRGRFTGTRGLAWTPAFGRINLREKTWLEVKVKRKRRKKDVEPAHMVYRAR